MTLTYHTDPGHGWLEVSPFALADVGLTVADFSGYSYVGPAGGEHSNPTRYYLEEDCDMAKFMEAFKTKHGEYPDLNETYADPCFVRDLPNIPRKEPA